MDRGYHVSDDRGLGFHLPPYPSTYSPPCPAISYHEEFCSKPDSTVEEPTRSLLRVPSQTPPCLQSPPRLSHSTLPILRRCVPPLPPTLIRTPVQHLTPISRAGNLREGCWARDTGERAMPRTMSVLWSLPALPLCTTLPLKKVRQ
ncbi:hypothetical protein XENOCAPTIV_008034 [Xenoophorus captivus]|uniref:Uncharacterized protein n=1 Tax=Xenoophorus captivus TaxID=1517983 RepID=A0ABV0R8U8_9TELE